MITLLLPDQIDALRAIESLMATMPDFDAASRFFVERAAAILDRPVALVERRGRNWRLLTSSAQDDDVPLRAAESFAAPSSDGDGVREVTIDDAPWTCIAVERREPSILVLVLAGDWTLSKPLLREWASRLNAAFLRFRTRLGTGRSRALRAAYALPRRLARCESAAPMYQAIVDACSTAVNAHKASIAIYHPEQQALAITATHGYPFVLVRQQRFRPGAGIIGTVFRSGRPVRGGDALQEATGAPRRLRYRSRSFVSVPLKGSAGVLGVISVSDPRDGAAFDVADLRILSTLAGIASLALDRARSADEAKTSARVAAVDALTGLFNRRHFHTRLEEEVERARRQNSPLALLLLDVDQFKQLNDRLGHLVGDAVLRVVGDVLRRSVRLFDVCARFGGDEFAILMPGSGAESTLHVAERIREGVEGSRPQAGGPWSDDLRVTTSIGIAPFGGGTSEELIGRADQALYAAKRAGRNRVHITVPPDVSEAPIA